MYYPIQIPYILNKSFAESVRYSEEIVPQLQDFVICLWEMQPRAEQRIIADNVIVADGCIDLVVDYKWKEIGFAGMSKTVFDDKIQTPSQYVGARLKPGAFHAITGLSATEAMDKFLPLDKVDKNFDTQSFFSLPFNEVKESFKNYLGGLIRGKESNEFTTLFDRFSIDIPDSATEIYDRLHFSPKHCQRLFTKHFGLSPQMVLSIIRFQKCLEMLTSNKELPSGVLEMINFYDQSHFIKDFKKNIGLTPLELVRKYTS